LISLNLKSLNLKSLNLKSLNLKSLNLKSLNLRSLISKGSHEHSGRPQGACTPFVFFPWF
jgi:hypothetical protein